LSLASSDDSPHVQYAHVVAALRPVEALFDLTHISPEVDKRSVAPQGMHLAREDCDTHFEITFQAAKLMFKINNLLPNVA
jgi:hypothetical protein